MVGVASALRAIRAQGRQWTLLFTATFLWVASSHAGQSEPTPTVEDAIAMSRIHHRVTADGTVGTFSPDGKRFATVLWRGDTARNVNLYSLVVMDLDREKIGRAPPRVVLTWEFGGDSIDHDASAFERVTFLADNRTIAFLGRKGNGLRQVYSVDIHTGRVKALTNHSREVSSFAVAADGGARVFSSVVDADEYLARLQKLDEDGVFLWDSRLFVASNRFKAKPVLNPQPRWGRQYFLQDRAGSTPIFDLRLARPESLPLTERERERGTSWQFHDEEMLRRWSTLTTDAGGRHALLYPYALADDPIDRSRFPYYQSADGQLLDGKLDAPYALIDLATGRLQKLIDAPHPLSGDGNGNPVWAPDGRSVAIFTVLPEGVSSQGAEQGPQWAQVDIATRAVTPLNVPPGWQVASWNEVGTQLMLYDKYMGFATLERDTTGQWGQLKRVDAARELNPIWQPATNGTWIVGVKDSTYSPPELVALDPSTGTLVVLTNLNPQLLQRRYGTVEAFHWKHRYDPDASGFLIKPTDFKSGRRYPLIVLLDDGALKGTTDPYLLDAVRQLSGHAIQMLAAEGFMVLYARRPRLLFDDSDGSEEGQRITEHVDAAIDRLGELGLIDTQRLGLSGWSRAAYHTDCILMRSSHRFAAATQIDGGGWEHLPQLRPFTDDELQRIRTPLLFEAHGHYGLMVLVRMTSMADRLEALGKPTEVLYFAAAPHSTIRPRHRLRSLQTHLDWWRFWLKREQDADPEKAEQYLHWRAMRAAWDEHLLSEQRERDRVGMQ